MTLVQKWFVMLDDERQLFLAYDSCGRIGNANRQQAFLYDSLREATQALRRVRRERRWPRARILGTTVDTQEIE